MMHKTALLFITILLSAAPLCADDFPQWRGPSGNGVITSPNSAAFPLQWSHTQNILWKTKLDHPGNSSPIVYGDSIFLTSANDDGTQRSLLCFDRATGKKRWQRDTPYPQRDLTHKANPWSAASPATDGQTIFTWNGSAGAAAYNFQGDLLWKRDLGPIEHKWGHASSPRLYKNAVIIHAGPGPSVNLYALDKQTGQTLWKANLLHAQSDPQALKGSFATPLLYKNGQRDELILPLPNFVVSFDPNTGKELWRCEGLGDLTYSDPIVGDGYIIAFSGFKGPSMGMRQPAPHETGDLTQTHRLWVDPTVTQRVGSGVIIDQRFYICGSKGPLQCLDANTGEPIWTHDIGEKAWSAITRLGDRLYLTDQSAVTHVFKPGDTYQPIAQNHMTPDKYTNATIAFSNGQLFLRTDQYLYAITTPQN